MNFNSAVNFATRNIRPAATWGAVGLTFIMTWWSPEWMLEYIPGKTRTEIQNIEDWHIAEEKRKAKEAELAAKASA